MASAVIRRLLVGARYTNSTEPWGNALARARNWAFCLARVMTGTGAALTTWSRQLMQYHVIRVLRAVRIPVRIRLISQSRAALIFASTVITALGMELPAAWITNWARSPAFMFVASILISIILETGGCTVLRLTVSIRRPRA